MELTILHDGQFFVAYVEYRKGERIQFVKYTFGPEPDNQTVLQFIHQRLLSLINSSEVIVASRKRKKRVNPKWLQRQVAKEQSKKKDLTLAQKVVKEEQELKKKQRKKKSKALRDKEKKYKRHIKREKAKAKHKGH